MIERNDKPPRAYTEEALGVALSGGNVSEFIESIPDAASRELAKAHLKIAMERIRFYAKKLASFDRDIDREKYINNSVPGKNTGHIFTQVMKYMNQFGVKG